MRIRRRPPLPFPTLLPSPFSLTDPSLSSQRSITPPKTDATQKEETTKANASAKIEQVLHPNQVLPPVDPSSLGTESTKRDSQEFRPVEVWKKEEEEEETESVESTRSKGAKVNTVKRRSVTTNNQTEQKQNQEEEQEQEKDKQEKKARRSAGSAVLMEGSRCSRVNGRGWRCCQPTLVGYSLCEHHLGKGRMRSMVSNEVQGQLGCTDSELKKKNSDEGLGEKNGRRKRNRVPTVKARSISSLLDEPNVDDYDDEDYQLIGYMRN